MRRTNTHILARAKKVLSAWTVSCIVLTLVRGPSSMVETAEAASSFRPTIFVNTEAFLIIDDDDTTADVVMRFGDTLAKTLSFNRSLDRFQFNDDVYVTGTVQATTILSGAVIYGAKSLRSSGSLVWEGAASGSSLIVSNNVGIAVTAAKAKLSVNGIMSGVTLYATKSLSGAGLTDCDGGTSKLLWDAITGRFSCGTDADTTYTAGQGLSLNGTSFRLNATVTGSVIKATTSLASSGTLVWEGQGSGSTLYAGGGKVVMNSNGITLNPGAIVNGAGNYMNIGDNSIQVREGSEYSPSSFFLNPSGGRVGVGRATGVFPKADLDVVGTISGSLVTQNGAGNNSFMGNVGIGATTAKAKLSVNGVMSGVTLYATRSFSGAGLTDCDSGTSKLLWDATTGRFSCGTVTSTAYTAGQGLSLNGTSFRVNSTLTGSLAEFSTVSGAMVYAERQLSVSGSVTLGESASDTIMFGGQIGSALMPNANQQYNVGDAAAYWNYGYFTNLNVLADIYAEGNISAYDMTLRNVPNCNSSSALATDSNGVIYCDIDDNAGYDDWGSGYFNITDGTSSESINNSDAINFVDGAGIDVVVSNTDTVTINSNNPYANDMDQYVGTDDSPGFAGLNVSGNVEIGDDPTSDVLNINAGAYLYGDVQLGSDSGDDIAMYGDITSDLNPNINNTYNFGNSSFRWATGWFNNLNVSAGISVLGTSSLTGNVGIGPANSTTKATLNVSGVLSGVTLYATKSFSGAGLTDCDTGGTSKLLWDATTGRFSCGTDSGATYTAGQGLTLNGTAFSLSQNISGSLLEFQTVSGSTVYGSKSLRSSGSLVWEGAGSGSSLSLAGGNMTVSSTGDAVFNENGLGTVDFRVESDTGTHGLFFDASARSGAGALGIGGAPDVGGPALRIYGETWQLAAGNIRTLVGESTSFYGGFQWVDSTNVFQIGTGTAGFDQISFYDSGGAVVINEPGDDADFRVESDTDVNALVVDGGLNNVGIGTSTPRTKLDVVGAISGSFVYATRSFSGAGLTDCDSASSKLLWDATTGRFSCGTVTATNWSGTGALQNAFDNRYVNTAGDTMTGALRIAVTGGNANTLSLRVGGAMSGAALVISGTGSNPLLSTDSAKAAVRVGGSGMLLLGSRSDPASVPANTTSIFSQNLGGRTTTMTKESSNWAPSALQASLFGNQIMLIKPGGGTTLTAEGTQALSDTTVSHPTADQVFGFMADFATAAVSGDEAGTSSSNTAAFRGSTTGANGFFYMARVGVVDTTSIRTFSGMADQTIATMVGADNPTGNHVGFQFSTARGDANWQFTTKDGTTQSVANTGIAFTANKVYDLYFTCTKQCASITWEIRNVTDGTSTTGTTSSNLPTTTAALRMVLGVESQTTTAKSIRMQQMYFESDR